MKVDTSRLKKGTSEVPTECQALIDKLRSCSMDELLDELKQIDSWTFGKSELYHWIDVLDIFDSILEDATKQVGPDWFLACDERFSAKKCQLLQAVLNFTTFLIEHSFSRHLYNSVEHLTQLLSSTNMEIVLAVLNLLYMFSKRSNFIPRLNCAKRTALLARLTYIAESWGGKEHGYGLGECCSDNLKLPNTFPKFYYEYYDTDGKLRSIEQDEFSDFVGITNPSEIAYLMCCRIPVALSDDQKMLIFTRVRLSLSFHNYETRLQFVLARLQALSVLVYSNSLQENINTLLYPGFLEELVELLELRQNNLVEIRAAALRTLTSIIHLDRNPHFPKKPGSRLMMIIDVTGAASYHGFLPTLVRTCIQHLTATSSTAKEPNLEQALRSNQQFPLPLATALFSFLYHLASYDSGGEALVGCGMMESLLRVINWPGKELEHITFVTRAVRVIDLITNIEMQSFQNHGGLQSFIGRLDMEVNICREEQPTELVPTYYDRSPDNSFLVSEDANMYEGGWSSNLVGSGASLEACSGYEGNMQTEMSSKLHSLSEFNNTSSSSSSSPTIHQQQLQLQNSKSLNEQSNTSTSKSCLPQRAALLKSMLNFLKKAIQDAAFSESIRHVMEGSLPSSLRHIISNAEYYGPSLFLLATDVVTVYVFQEPSLLYSLQDSGLTDVVLQALLKKEVPPTREVLGSLPNVFSALCLNARGLAAFVQYKPFDRLFEVLLSPLYLQAMRRRRSSDPMGDTASNLGNAMDELMRHQPSLKTEATKAIIRLLEELVMLGTDERYICWRAHNNKNDDSNNAAGTGSSSNNISSGRHSVHVRVIHGNNSNNRGHNNLRLDNNSGDADVRGSACGGRTGGADNDSNSATGNVVSAGGNGNDTASSDEEDDDEEEASTSSHHRNQRDNDPSISRDRMQTSLQNERTPIPLIDYILNVMKFVDAILSNNSTDDHCREFVNQGGLQPLLSILSLPNLPVESPITASAQGVAAVCKSILSLAHEPQVLQVSLEQLASVVSQLEPLQNHWEKSQGSVLLRELANCNNIETAFSNAKETPLLHSMSAVHGYVVMLVHVCRTGQSEIRNLLIDRWSQNNKYGRELLYKLVQLYTALVWESTLLLALCTDDIIPVGCDFGKDDLDKLPKEKCSDSNLTTTGDHQADVTNKNSHQDTVINEIILQESNSDIDRVLSMIDTVAATENMKAKLAANKSGATAGTSSSFKPTQRRVIATPSQLKYIKLLLGASSRLGRALAELFGLLVKLCVGNRIRMRHPQNVASTHMSSASRDIATVLSYILVDGLSHDQLPPSPIPKLKQTFLICSIGFTSPMLFDEKRYAYHLMLHTFCEEGGLQAFFDMFDFALEGMANNKKLSGKDSDENNTNDKSDYEMKSYPELVIPKEDAIKDDDHDEFPLGSGEFLDAWLMLLEKMVNPKAILESSHVITLKSLRNKPEFDTLSYLINVHRLAFESIKKIWFYKPIRTYGPRMTDSMLTIVKHIFKGEPLLREKYNKKIADQAAAEKQQSSTLKNVGNKGLKTVNATANLFDSTSIQMQDNIASTSSATNALNTAFIARPAAAASLATHANLNQAHLNQLMDMGFLLEDCREALYYAASVEQATEYLLSNANETGSTSANTAAARQSQSSIPYPINQPTTSNATEPISNIETPKAEDEKMETTEDIQKGAVPKRNRREMRTSQITLPNGPPLSEETLATFSEQAVNTCLYLIDQIPDAVYKGTELLTILFRRPEIKWKMLATIIGTLNDCADRLYDMLCERVISIETIFFGEVGGRFAVRLQIFSLLLEGQYIDIRTPAILSIKEFKLMPRLIRLLNETEAVLTMKAGKCQYTPKWLSQMILLIDLYEKVVILTRRRNEMHRITTNIWKWYDVASGKWNAYSVANNKLINDAYWAAESSVRVSVGRHRYTINFNCMSQVNEETGNHRPVVLGLASVKRFPERATATLSYIFGSDNEDMPANKNNPAANETSQNASAPAANQPIGESNSSGNANANNPDIPAPKTTANQPEELDRTTAAALLEMRISHREHLLLTDYTMALSEAGQLKTTEPPPFSSTDVKLLGLEEFSTGDIVATSVRLMAPKVMLDRDTLHALMKLCVRLTTRYENSEIFAREGGIKLLLELKQSSGYVGYSTLANLLIRHTLEEPRTLAMAMEKVIAARTLQTIPPGYRDLIFMLRRMSSAVARDPEVFKQVAKSMMRIDVNALRRGVFSEDIRLIMKSISPSTNAKRNNIEKANDSSISHKVITDLLQALIVPIVSSPQNTAGNNIANDATLTATASSKEQHQNRHPTFAYNNASMMISTHSSSNSNDTNEEFIFRHRRPLAGVGVPCEEGEGGEGDEDDEDDNMSLLDENATSSVTNTLETVPSSVAAVTAPLSVTNNQCDQHRSALDGTGIDIDRLNSNQSQDNINGGADNTNANVSDAAACSNTSRSQSKNTSAEAWNSTSNCPKTATATENEKPLLSKSTILKALAEAVRSYQSVGVIIAEYTYQPQPKTLIRKPQPALAFILDTLLPSTGEPNPDRECSAGARMLIAALSAATDSQVTQNTVVHEVRQAILRALSWPEIPEKHQQLQLLTALIPTMIENCPPDNPALLRFHHHQPRRNDIFNIMVRKGLIADLANITQNLDLSSPHTVHTIGTALKSLEQLLRMSNQPASSSSVPLQLNRNRGNDGDSLNTSNVRQISRRHWRSCGIHPPLNASGSINLANNAANDIIDDDDDDDEDEDDDQSNVETTLVSNEGDNLNSTEPAASVAVGENISDDVSGNAAQSILMNSSSGGIRRRDAVNLVAQVQAIGTMEELMEHFLDRRDPTTAAVLDAHQSQTRPSASSNATANRGPNSSTNLTGNTIAGSNSGGNANVNQVIELAEDRFIMEEDDESSSGSDSNQSDENDGREMEDEDDDENEEEPEEDRSELDVDEDTRQFMEMYDHVYGGRHLSPSIPELERDSEDILMIQYADNSGGNGGAGSSNTANANNGNVGVGVNVSNNVIDDDDDQNNASNNASTGNQVSSVVNRAAAAAAGPSSSNTANDGNSSSGRYLLRTSFPSLFEANNRHDESVSGNGDASNESATPGSPSTSNLSIGSLNLNATGLGRSGVVTTGSGSGNGNSSIQQNSLSQLIQFRAQRTSSSNSRQRRCAYLSLNSRNPNPPAILQRLLGPSVAQNVNIGLGQVIANANGPASFRDATRVVVMDNGFGIFSNSGEPTIDLVDQAGYLFGRSLAATLNSTPSPLHWWLEEAKILGLESQADVCLTVCNDLIPELEVQRSLEMSKTRGKRKKKQTLDADAEGTAASQSQVSQAPNLRTLSTDTDLQEPLPETTLTTQASVPIASSSLNTPTIENTDTQQQETDNENINRRVIVIGGDNPTVFTEECNNEENYDSASLEETDDSDQDDDNSSKDEQALESNEEEMTESDCNGQEEESNQNENAVNADAGAVSDSSSSTSSSSGQSLASSVSTEAFYQAGNSGQLHHIQDRCNLFDSNASFAPVVVGNNDNEDGFHRNTETGLSSHDAIGSDHQRTIARSHHSTGATQELRTYDELCNIESNNVYTGPSISLTETGLPSINLLQPLSIHLECSTPTSSNNVNDSSTNRIDEVDQILKVIKKEYGEEDVIILDDENDEVNKPTGNDNTEEKFDKGHQLSQHNIEEVIDEILETNSNIDDDSEENENEQEPKRQRLNCNEEPLDDDDVTANAQQSQESSNFEVEDNDNDNQNQWQPRRRLLRGRRLMARGNRDTRSGTTPLPSNSSAENTNQLDEEQSITSIPNENLPSSSLATISQEPAAQTEPVPANDSSHFLTSSTGSVMQVPEGIDPSFLAALPEEMREEVISEHMRILRLERTRSQQQAAMQIEQQAMVEVNPEFLAALPPNIQEEVLAQQRIEQQRQAAAAANPDDPVDAAAFFQNLQPSLRQAILTDMEDSQISVLPPELAAEAQNLRRDWENRNRQIMQEQINQIGGSGSGGAGNSGGGPGAGSFSSVLRYRSRLPEPIFSAQNLQRMRWSNWGINAGANTNGGSEASGILGRELLTAGGSSNILADLKMEQQGRPLLDHESLSSLLILLFVEASKICTLRFHRVIRNLCYHIPTRDWIIRTIISIIEKCDIQSNSHSEFIAIGNRPHWLNIRLDAALGNRNNVFIIQRKQCDNKDPNVGEELSETEDDCSIAIHPQASQVVCRHALDLLISLAKNFPTDFLPIKKSITESKKEKSKAEEDQPSTSSSSNPDNTGNETITDFWEILLRLELNAQKHRLASSNATPLQSSPTTKVQNQDFKEIQVTSFSESPFGQLISMLSLNIIVKNSMLTDKLLRLLSFISIGLPDAIQHSLARHSNETNESGASGSTTAAGSPTLLVPTSDLLRSKSKLDDKCLPESQDNLRLAIEVLTLKSCSEEGLEDATTLLLNLSQCSSVTRTFILKLLIDGAKFLANVVQKQIKDLIFDLKHLKRIQTTENQTFSPHGSQQHQGPSTSSAPDTILSSSDGSSIHNKQQSSSYQNSKPSTSNRGVLQDRFTKETVVITSTGKQKPRFELQLSSMVPLVSKTASQSFFLRILKVIIQIRESAKDSTLANISSPPISASEGARNLSGGSTSAVEPGNYAQTSQNTSRSNRKNTLNPIETQPLSKTLQLDHLWDTLSECLVELEENADHHAVLVLQPAVEAFFLVHATSSVSSSSSSTNKNKPTTNDAAAENAPNAGIEDDEDDDTEEEDGDDDDDDSDEDVTNEQIVDGESNVDMEPTNETSQSNNMAPVSPISLFDIPNSAFVNTEARGNLSQQEDTTSGGGNNRTTTAASEANVNSNQQNTTKTVNLTSDQRKFLTFAEKHRTVLNQILRQSTVHLSDGPFAVLVDHTRILDFDVKRRYFRTELERMDEGIRREELAVHVHRVTVFEDSFRELYRRNPEEWKNRFYIVFEDEEGQDAGGLLREWYVIISREIFNPMYALFTVSPGDRVTYMINASSHANSNHLFYFKFVGRVIAKAIYDNKLLECYFTRSFYKHILGIEVNTQDMESEDYEFYKGLIYLMEHHVSELGYEQTFSLEVQEFGVTEVRDLIPNGRNIAVTEENKNSYIHLVCQLKMSGSIKQQLNAFLEGFYDIIPKRLISIFNEQELELLISGLPNVDIEDLKANTEYHKYQSNSIQIQWFWRALRSFDQADRAKFLQFVTGTSKVPLQGFGALEGMNGIQKFQIHRDDRSTERLPSAHTCFNQLDLPVYKTYDKLRSSLLKAIHECSEGFGFA